MRFLLKASIPHEPFNSLVRAGTAGPKLRAIMEDVRPEAAYFIEEDGKRTALLIIDLADASKMPSFSEPFFLTFNADCRFHPVMLPDDLGKAGLEQLGKRWS